ncbi:MAG TPA: hypothetical protein VNW15_00185 [Rhizomicrobium sp.]|nr:hypothetical protein [Rhizomicrobium sp.]
MAGTEQAGQKPASAFTIGFILGWTWTVLAAGAGAIAFVYLGQPLAGVTLVLSALAACPLAVSILEKQAGTKLGGGPRLILALIFAGLAGLSLEQNPAGWEKLVAGPAPPQAKTLLEDQGDFGNKTTKLFTPQGKDWTLQWSFDCASLGDSGNFNAKLMRQDGGASPIATVEKINDRDSGTEQFHQSGTFYLQVVSECRWTIKVDG